MKILKSKTNYFEDGNTNLDDKLISNKGRSKALAEKHKPKGISNIETMSKSRIQERGA